MGPPGHCVDHHRVVSQGQDLTATAARTAVTIVPTAPIALRAVSLTAGHADSNVNATTVAQPSAATANNGRCDR